MHLDRTKCNEHVHEFLTLLKTCNQHNIEQIAFETFVQGKTKEFRCVTACCWERVKIHFKFFYEIFK